MEEKIKEIAKKIEAVYQMGGLSDGLYYDFAKSVALEYGDFIRQQTLEEVRKCVPRENDKSSGKDFEKMILGYFTLGFNDCRQQTLENIDKLSTPSSNK